MRDRISITTIIDANFCCFVEYQDLQYDCEYGKRWIKQYALHDVILLFSYYILLTMIQQIRDCVDSVDKWPANEEPSIQWKSLISTALTSIQKPVLCSKWNATERNSLNLDWMLLLVMRGREEFRCWQSFWDADWFSHDPSVQRQMLASL